MRENIRTYKSELCLDEKEYNMLSMVGVLLSIFFFSSLGFAQITEQYEDVIIQANRINADHLAETQGARIYSGKKTSRIDIANAPRNVNNNYRQALAKTPGLLLSEESTPLLSLGYRGLNPHRAQFTQVLKDGIPIHADMFGYPEAYFTPALETVDHIEFVKGGGSLIYGPQPGGVINYITKDPIINKSLMVSQENIVGSDDLFSNYTSFMGIHNDTAYHGFIHHRQGQGFRDFNSQFDVLYSGIKVSRDLSDTKKMTFVLDGYQEEHGEPGGLTRADFDNNPNKTNRLNDKLEINRYAAHVTIDHQVSEDLYFEHKFFTHYYERLSWRQRTSVSNFGLAPSGANASSNDIESQKFYMAGTDNRFKYDYQGVADTANTLTAGILYYHVTSPRHDKRGSSGDALNGSLRKDADRWVNNVAIFVENLTKIGKLSITPGFRLENIWQRVRENTNADKTNLADSHEYEVVPLLGLGTTYEMTDTTQAYANISQSYRPKIFTEAVPTGSGQTVNNDLKEGKAWQTDIGIRGNPVKFYQWDMSYFFMSFKDQIGTSGTTVDNVGDAHHQGIELANTLDIIGLYDFWQSTKIGNKVGQLNLFANTMILEAHFTKGSNKGKTPQYAPDFIFKTGLEYNYLNKAKLRFAGTFVDDHYANDTNTEQFAVSSYKVWDLALEMNVYKDMISLTGGINNIFDEQYYARVRSDGIDPANGRNYYMGAKISW